MTNNILVLDTEATIYEKGHPFSSSNKLCCVGTLFNDSLEYHDIEHSGLPYHRSIQRLSELLKQAKLIVGFNIKYDLHWLRLYIPDIPFNDIFDCQLAEFLIRNQTNPYPSLDFSARLRGMEPKHDLIATDYWERGINTDLVPVTILQDRVLHDVKLTYELYLSQVKELEEQGKTALHKLQCQDLLSLQEMEFNGMAYDVLQSNTKAKEVGEQLVLCTDRLNALVPSGGIDRVINWNSNLHISAILYGGQIRFPVREKYDRLLKSGEVKHKERWGEKVVRFARLVEPLKGSEAKAEGIWFTNEDVLKSLKAKSPAKEIIKLLLEQAKLEKLVGTYYTGIPNLIEKMQWKDDVIHGQLNQCVARTGRLSSSKPNLQNFDGELKPLFYSRNGTLLNVDVKGLEWVCAAYLSQDPIAMKEIINGLDHHEINRARFNFPSRLIAKTFLFRLIYGGSAYSYAHDQDFTDVSTNEKFWQKIIDETYSKYKGLALWHKLLVQQATLGNLVMPTGRQYSFKKKEGSDNWPRTQILNYPVQGLGADLLSIFRVSLYKRFKKLGIKSDFICTVHDSVLIDCFDEEVPMISQIITNVFQDLPKNFKRVFGKEFNLPLIGELEVGNNWGDMSPLVTN